MNFNKLNRLRHDSPNSNSTPANGSDSKLPTRPRYKYENLSFDETADPKEIAIYEETVWVVARETLWRLSYG